MRFDVVRFLQLFPNTGSVRLPYQNSSVDEDGARVLLLNPGRDANVANWDFPGSIHKFESIAAV